MSVIQIVFEGMRGLTESSDIALDDVLVTKGECGTPGSCDFENGLCAWSNSQGDDFDWIVRAGQTDTVNTGPNGDHTLATNLGL
ncbi:hypothetical protein DPMN_011669 [Dreissena polymorpha]|uniref:MAM domain-containing protein n=1 Tax=Dreissena polymorpha TaxID=45954 RepID=A0A9D4N4F9_DREPO|nr:hypothetical protein DPMN_011669 [Dreissena polymorpha]